jgi:hypothetical protein
MLYRRCPNCQELRLPIVLRIAGYLRICDICGWHAPLSAFRIVRVR